MRVVLALALAWVAPADAEAEARVALVPERAPPWRVSRALESLRDGARTPREVRVETTPVRAELELAYLRDGAQLVRARGVAPLVAALPGVALTGESDRVVVRATLAGFAPLELVLGARQIERTLRIALTPQPRRLIALSLLELGDRARLELRSDRPIDARLASSERGWRLVLADVSLDDALALKLAEIRGHATPRLEARAAGADVIIELARAPDEHRELRLTRRDEAVRAISRLALEWLPADRGESTLAHARRALAQLSAAHVGACGDSFERALIASLGSETLARALAPAGAFTDGFVALAIERLAALSPHGEVALRVGSRARVDDAIARAPTRSREPPRRAACWLRFVR